MATQPMYVVEAQPRAFRELLASFERMSRAHNRAEITIRTYRTALLALATWLRAHARADLGPDLDMARVRKADLEAYIADLLSRQAPSTATKAFAIIHAWFSWLTDEEEIPSNPMARMQRPTLPEKLPPVPTDEAISAILAACAGRSFTDRRDLAIIRLLLDTGMRLKEITGLALADLDLDSNIARVKAKGTPGSERLCPFGHKAALALDRYLRARRSHRCAEAPALWLSQRGKMCDDSIYYVVRRRAEEAGYAGMHPHLFRHAFAHLWLAAGGQETHLLSLAGWRSSDMLRRYGASLAGERARNAHRELSPGDRF